MPISFREFLKEETTSGDIAGVETMLGDKIRRHSTGSKYIKPLTEDEPNVANVPDPKDQES